MLLKQITKPATEPITIDDVEGQLRYDIQTPEQATVNRFITAIRKRAETITRRALITQQYELRLDRFPYGNDFIKIPLPPLQSIESIVYTDLSQVQQTLDSSLYNVFNQDDKLYGYVVPVYGSVWPTALSYNNSVVISFTCGYGPIAPGITDNVPEEIKQWMLINIANLYENRESIIVGQRLATVDTSKTLCDVLLEDYRMQRL